MVYAEELNLHVKRVWIPDSLTVDFRVRNRHAVSAVSATADGNLFFVALANRRIKVAISTTLKAYNSRFIVAFGRNLFEMCWVFPTM